MISRYPEVNLDFCGQNGFQSVQRNGKHTKMSEALITQANEFLAKYPKLHEGGFYERDVPTQWNFKKIETIKDYILKNYEHPSPKTRTHIYGSYYLKHRVEESKWTEEQDKYVANGELILAMLCAGYKADFKRSLIGSPNCNFKVNIHPKPKKTKQAQPPQVSQESQPL